MYCRLSGSGAVLAGAIVLPGDAVLPGSVATPRAVELLGKVLGDIARVLVAAARCAAKGGPKHMPAVRAITQNSTRAADPVRARRGLAPAEPNVCLGLTRLPINRHHLMIKH